MRRVQSSPCHALWAGQCGQAAAKAGRAGCAPSWLLPPLLLPLPLRRTSRNRTMLGCPDSMRWLMISRSTFLSICGRQQRAGWPAEFSRQQVLDRTPPPAAAAVAARRHPGELACCGGPPGALPPLPEPPIAAPTFSPRSMNFTATSSPLSFARHSLATPKLPEPISRICAGAIGR